MRLIRTSQRNFPTLILARFHHENRHALFRVGQDYLRTANFEILHGTKSGRVYTVRTRRGQTGIGRKRRHKASAATDTAHANMTGILRRSLGWKVRGHSRLEFGYGVDKRAPEYASWVEDGTIRMAARKTADKAIKANRRNTMNHLETGMGRAIRL